MDKLIRALAPRSSQEVEGDWLSSLFAQKPKNTTPSLLKKQVGNSTSGWFSSFLSRLPLLQSKTAVMVDSNSQLLPFIKSTDPWAVLPIASRTGQQYAQNSEQDKTPLQLISESSSLRKRTQKQDSKIGLEEYDTMKLFICSYL